MLFQLLVLVLPLHSSVDGQLICPYCDPNYVDIPGLFEASRGYDTPMGNPNPGEGKMDPGIRKQIFSPMVRDEDGHYVVDGSFVAGNGQIKCDGDLSSHVYDKFEDYVKGMMSRTTTGFGIEVGRPIGVRQEPKYENDTSEIIVGIPPLFSRSWNDNDDVNEIKNFYKKEGGSITVTEAICLTHRVDIFGDVKQVLLNGFIESVKDLEEANNATQKIKEEKFKNFIDEYGTHYQSTSKLGTRITVERRYSKQERKSVGKNDLTTCANLAGAALLGIQMEYNRENCSNGDLLQNKINSSFTERTKVSTYGSFLAENIADWSQQVVSLVNEGKFQGRVIQRALKIISDLFTDENFEDFVRKDGQPLDLAGLRSWFEPMLINEYCRIFNISCEVAGCGINDPCMVEEWCIYMEEKDPGGKDPDLSPIREEFICLEKNVSIVLPNGNAYLGSVHRDEVPHGWGIELKGNDTEDILYEGHWLDGKREFSGTIYRTIDTTPYYSGQMKNDKMNGEGVLYYGNGVQMFVGIMKDDHVVEGILYTDTELPKVITEINAENMADIRTDYENHQIFEFLPQETEQFSEDVL